MKGMLFNQDHLNRVLKGEKTQMRFLTYLDDMNCKPDNWESYGVKQDFLIKQKGRNTAYHGIYAFFKRKTYNSPFYPVRSILRIGDIVYLKEGIWVHRDFLNNTEGADLQHNVNFYYNYDLLESQKEPDGWIKTWFIYVSPELMSEQFARYFIEITNIRIERIKYLSQWELEGYDNKKDFTTFWDKNNQPFLYEHNPWIWMVEFCLIT